MEEDPYFCDDCGIDLTHDAIETLSPVPELEVETYDMTGQVAEVYQCAHCSTVIGFSASDE